MTGHEPYEIVCALAASGQLTARERARFDVHCTQCPACRRQLEDLISIGLQLQLDAAIHATSAPMSAGALERFRARAMREGIALRSAPARPSPLYALATAACVLVIVAALVSMPGRRKASENPATFAAVQIPIPQSLPGPDTTRKSVPQPPKAIHSHLMRCRFVRHTDVDAGVNEAGLAAQQFPHVITASYPFFGTESTAKSLPAAYPALSRSQISHLNLFPALNDSSAANTERSNRTIDIASTGKIFDFAANIRQIRFQLPTVQ
jgi:hypothetical protein